MRLQKHPLPDKQIISPFGMRRHPVYGDMRLHEGVDFRAATGTSIYAAADGKVSVSKMQGNKKGYGEYIVIEHDGFQTLYAHLSIRSVKVNQTVKAGQVIGKVGSTGDSTGPHLHFGMCKNFSATNRGWVDPAPYLSEVRDLTKDETIKLIRDELSGLKKIYKKPGDLPVWAEPTIRKMIMAGHIAPGADGSINMSEDLVRTLVILDRRLG